MILTFKNKALMALFETGDTTRIHQNHVKRLRLILAKLHTAEKVNDLRFPGSDLHALTGDLQGFWSLKVNSNWRLIFRMVENRVYDVDYLDYH